MLRIIECTCIYIGLLQKVITGRTKSTVQLFRGEQSSYVCTTRGTDENSTGEISVTIKKTAHVYGWISTKPKNIAFFRKWNRQDLSLVAVKKKKKKRKKGSTFHAILPPFCRIVEKFSSYGLIRKKNTYDAWGEKKRLIFISRINLRRKRERAVSPFIVPRGCQEKNANGVARLSRKKISTPAFAGLPVKIKRDEFFVEYREGDLFRDSLRGNTVYLYPRPG